MQLARLDKRLPTKTIIHITEEEFGIVAPNQNSKGFALGDPDMVIFRFRHHNGRKIVGVQSMLLPDITDEYVAVTDFAWSFAIPLFARLNPFDPKSGKNSPLILTEEGLFLFSEKHLLVPPVKEVISPPPTKPGKAISPPPEPPPVEVPPEPEGPEPKCWYDIKKNETNDNMTADGKIWMVNEWCIEIQGQSKKTDESAFLYWHGGQYEQGMKWMHA